MNAHDLHPDTLDSEGLPSSPEAARVDALLPQVARSARHRAGLEGRVYAASVTYLSAERSAHPSVRVLSLHAARAGRIASAGRFAMAACMAVAFVAGSALVNRPLQDDDRAFIGLPLPEGDAFELQLAEAHAIVDIAAITFDDLEQELAALESADLFRQ